MEQVIFLSGRFGDHDFEALLDLVDKKDRTIEKFQQPGVVQEKTPIQSESKEEEPAKELSEKELKKQ